MGRRWFLLLLLLAGCADQPQPPAGPGDPVRGAALFNAPLLADGAPSCRNCHALEQDVILVGPSLAGMADRAAQVVPSLSATAYLEQAIVNPNAHLVAGFDAGAMYERYEADLTPQEIADLVAFLLTLTAEPPVGDTPDDET